MGPGGGSCRVVVARLSRSRRHRSFSLVRCGERSPASFLPFSGGGVLGWVNEKGTRRCLFSLLVWWRRRESNPRPQDLRLRLYMLIRVFVLTGGYPTGRDNHKRSRLSFSGSAPGSFSTILRDRRPVLDAQARLQSDGTLLVFKQRVRSCRRWQLLVCSCFYEGSYSLGMHLGFCDPRRNHVVPLVLV